MREAVHLWRDIMKDWAECQLQKCHKSVSLLIRVN